MHTSSGTPMPHRPHQKLLLGSNLSLSTQSWFPKPQPNLRPQTQTPKQQLQLRALPTQACSYPGLWVNSCSLSGLPGLPAARGASLSSCHRSEGCPLRAEGTGAPTFTLFTHLLLH